MKDIFVVNPELFPLTFKKIKERYPHARALSVPSKKNEIVFKFARTKALTKSFWIIKSPVDLVRDLDYDIPSWDSKYVHKFEHDIYQITKDCTYEGYKNIDIVFGEKLTHDIFFISYHEPCAEANFDKLKSRFPRAQWVKNIKGIHRAHKTAASKSTTDMLWVVDADAEILEDFNFDFETNLWDLDVVHVWRSRNPINNLEYGYGGVKLLPTTLTLNLDESSPDMTTSISPKFKAMEQVSNITAFNTDPYSAWRSAFRECVKLSSKIINNQNIQETEDRLNTWCTVTNDIAYGKFVLDGALAGKAYGIKHASDRSKLAKINNFNWLKAYWLLRRRKIK
jgi:hypothetical protein